MNTETIKQAKKIGTLQVKRKHSDRDVASWVVALLSSGPASKSDILRTFRWLSAGALDDACKKMLDDGMISAEMDRSAKGRPTMMLRLTDAAIDSLRSG